MLLTEEHIRPETTDLMTKKEIRSYRLLPIPEGSVILDVGAHIGFFTRWALSQGAAKSFCFEPEPNNFQYLQMNTSGLPVECNNVAVTGDGRDVQLNVKTSGHTGGHSIVFNGPTRSQLVVKSVAFRDIVNKIQPNVVKIDCEGAEFEFDLPNSLPKSVQYLTMEVHFNKRELRHDKAPKLLEAMKSWRTIKPFNVTPKAWTIVGVWERGN